MGQAGVVVNANQEHHPPWTRSPSSASQRTFFSGTRSAVAELSCYAGRRGQVLGFCAKRDPCLIGLEAGATLHDWARKFQVLGHDLRLIPPIYVKPHGKRQKNDAAEAICEAVQRPALRFVAVNSAEQQGVLMLHGASPRELLVGQGTALINGPRGPLC